MKMSEEKFDAMIDELKEAFYFILEDYGIRDVTQEKDDRVDTVLCRLMRSQFVTVDE